MNCCPFPDLEFENHKGACTVFCTNCHRVHSGTMTEEQARAMVSDFIEDHEMAERMHDDEWMAESELEIW